MSEVPDRIEKKIVLRAPRSRVWRAISDAREFGAWFGAELDVPFTPGAHVTGRITPTKVDPEVAKLQEPAKGMPFELIVDRVEPERLISFRWHPFAIDRNVDYSSELTFELSEAEGGTLLTITETGFSRIPLARRAAAFRANDSGWQHQTKLVEKWLAQHA